MLTFITNGQFLFFSSNRVIQFITLLPRVTVIVILSFSSNNVYKADSMRSSWFTNCDDSFLLRICVDKKNGVLITATVYCALNGSVYACVLLSLLYASFQLKCRRSPCCAVVGPIKQR